MTKLKTIQEVAEEMATNLVTGTRTNGEQYVHMKNKLSIGDYAYCPKCKANIIWDKIANMYICNECDWSGTEDSI